MSGANYLTKIITTMVVAALLIVRSIHLKYLESVLMSLCPVFTSENRVTQFSANYIFCTCSLFIVS